MDFSMLSSLIPGLAQILQGAMGSFGGGGKNPAGVANGYINQIPGATEPYYSPYINAGKGAMGDLQNQYKDLFGGNVQNKLGESYKESPGYQFKLKQGLQAATNAASAGGMGGSPMDQQTQNQVANDISSQDYNDYIKNQIGLYNTGMGAAQDIFGKGYGASSDYANTLGTALSQQGAYGYAGQAGQNQAGQANWKNIIEGLGNLFGGHGRGI